MQIKFLVDYEAKTAGGSRLIIAGTVLDLSPEKAGRLVKAGLAEPAGLSSCVVVWRTASGRIIYLVETEELKERCMKPGEAWFTRAELEQIKGTNPEDAEKLIDIKEVFNGASILETEILGKEVIHDE